jgi:CHASE2 domain-containing sensor protein
MGHSLNRTLSALILVLGLGLRIADPSIIGELQARFFDFLQELKQRQYVPVPVRVVDIDDASLERLGQWPWPRILIDELIGRLNKAGATVVALDMVLGRARSHLARITPGSTGSLSWSFCYWVNRPAACLTTISSGSPHGV